jgi:hypothetical protein
MTLEQKAWELFIKNLKMPLASAHVKILANECFSMAKDFESVAGNYQISISHDEFLRKKAIDGAANALVEKMGKYDFPVEAAK